MGAEKHHPENDKLQSKGRKENAAQPLNEAPDNAGAERYPSTNKDDSIAGEPRSFEGVENAPRQGAGDDQSDPGMSRDHMGPGGDPAEGKR